MQIYTIVFGLIVIIIGGGWFYFSGYQGSNPVETGGVDDYVMEAEVEKPLLPSDSLPPQTTEENVVDMSGQGLTSVPDSIFSRSSVVSLDLSNNNLQGSLPAEMRLLANLEILDLSNNQFTGVPAEIGQLTQLRILNLSNNPITGLPHELGNLSNLQVLDLTGTNFAEADLEIIKAALPSAVEIRI